MDFKTDTRFLSLKPFENKLSLSCSTVHGDEQKWISDAIAKNQLSNVGENIDFIENAIAKYVGVKYAVSLSSGTSSLHMAIKLAGEKLYGAGKPSEGSLKGKRVFCSDLTFNASVNPIAYEGGEAVFIDSEHSTWNMCPEALEHAFEIYPEVRLVIAAHLYGVPAKMQEIRDICRRHGALIVEDAAESLGAKYKLDGEWLQTGCVGNYNCISFNGNKIITGSAGGMFLTNDFEAAEKIRKWSNQSREKAPWYQHEEIGYNYRMSNVVAGIVRGQFPFMEEHISRKKEIWERYKAGFSGLPLQMNPFDCENSVPNFWLSCIIIDEDAMSLQIRDECSCKYETETGKSCPQEILDALIFFNSEARPIWKPMHLQPMYKSNPFVSAGGSNVDVSADIFRRGLCLPSDIKMAETQQDVVIDIVRRCFK